MSAADIPSLRQLAAEHGVEVWRLRAKGTLAGRMAAVPFRWRRSPAQALRAALSRRRERDAGPPPPPRRQTAAFVIMAGPGERAGLDDALESIARWHGDDAGIVVLDDATTDCTDTAIRSRWPDVVVVRNRWPHAMPPFQYPAIARLLDTAIRQFDPDVVVKLDTDALLTGPGLVARAAGDFARRPELGLLGTVEAPSYDLWVLRSERRTSLAIRRLHDAALAGGYDGRKAHGGTYVLSREALQRMRSGGWLHWRPPLWTILNEDASVALAVHACGLGVGWPAGDQVPIRSISHGMPIALEDTGAQGVLAVHSVRRGLAGESERDVRRFFAAARDRSPDAPER